MRGPSSATRCSWPHERRRTPRQPARRRAPTRSPGRQRAGAAAEPLEGIVPARCVGGLVGVASRGVGGPDDELDDAADRAVAQRQHVEAEGQVTRTLPRPTFRSRERVGVRAWAGGLPAPTGRRCDVIPDSRSTGRLVERGQPCASPEEHADASATAPRTPARHEDQASASARSPPPRSCVGGKSAAAPALSNPCAGASRCSCSRRPRRCCFGLQRERGRARAKWAARSQVVPSGRSPWRPRRPVARESRRQPRPGVSTPGPPGSGCRGDRYRERGASSSRRPSFCGLRIA